MTMDNTSFDSLTRQAAAGGALSGPLAFLSAPGAAALARQLKAKGKKRGKKNRRRAGQACPPAVDRCAPQGDTCFTILSGVCSGPNNCLDKLVCCSSLSTCDSEGFFDCLLA